VNSELPLNLERVLADLLAAHEELLALAAEQRGAISRADLSAMDACSRGQEELARRIASLDTQRRQIVHALAGPGPGENLRISSIAQSLPEPGRGRIAGLAHRLREVLAALQEQNHVLRSAAGTLAGHMEGLMQQVARKLNQEHGMAAGMYGRQGRVQDRPIACALDMSH
jgi:hypothetical protein